MPTPLRSRASPVLWPRCSMRKAPKRAAPWEIADEVARLGARLRHREHDGRDDHQCPVALEELWRHARLDGRRGPAPFVSRRWNRAAASESTRATRPATGQPWAGRGAGNGRGVRIAASVRVGDRHGGSSESHHPRGDAGVLASEFRAQQCGARRGRRSQCPTCARAPKRPSGPGLGALQFDQCSEHRRDPREGHCVWSMPGTPQTQLRVAGIGRRRSSPTSAAAGHEQTPRRPLLEPHQHESTRGSTATPTEPAAVSRSVRPPARSGGRRGPDRCHRPAVAEISRKSRHGPRPMTADELQRAKDSMSNSLPGRLRVSANAVGNFSNVFLYDLGLDYYSRYAAQVTRRHRRSGGGGGPAVPRSGEMVVIAVGDRSTIDGAATELGPRALSRSDADGKKVNCSGFRLSTNAKASSHEPGAESNSACDNSRTGTVGYGGRHPGSPRASRPVLDLIGNAPLIRLSSFEAGLRNVELYAKAESA